MSAYITDMQASEDNDPEKMRELCSFLGPHQSIPRYAKQSTLVG